MGKEQLVRCPFHHDTTPSATFNTDKELFYCFTCGFGLNGAQLAERLHLEEKPESNQDESEPEDYDMSNLSDTYDIGYASYEHPYLAKRGVSPVVAGQYRVGYKDSLPQAMVMPITALKGNVVGAQYRYLEPSMSGARYKTFGKVTPLWPMHMLNGMMEIVVVEGAFSAMRMSTYLTSRFSAFVPVFATLGAKANQEIVDTVRPLVSVFLYDNDKAGRTACLKLRKLYPTVNAWTLNTSPDDMNDEQIEELMEKMIDRIGMRRMK
jgi:DNA primase